MGRSDERQNPLLDALGRRQFLGGVAAAGAVAGAGGLLAACGGSSGGGGGGAASPSASSTGSAAGTPKRGGSLSVGMTGGSADTDTLDPHGGLTYLDTARAHSLYNPLYQLDHNAQPDYVLAEDNGITADHGDTTQWTIKLRAGVHFHNGKPLTADDVVYTFKRIINGNGKYAGANSLGPMDLNNLKADGPTTVRVKFHQPYGSFVDQLAYWYYLYIIPEGLDPAGKDKNKPNGTGPFKLDSFTPGQQSVMSRNDNYFHTGKPYLDKLTIVDFSDSNSMQNALTTGVIQAAGGIEGPQVAALSSNPTVKTVASKTGAIVPFTMRVDIAPFNDVKVRQAMRLIVDRQQLIESALNGFATVGADVFSPYDPAYKGYTRQADIPQAKSLLKSAGKEGLQVTLTTSPVATGTVAMATVLAEQAKAAGVDIKVNNVSPSVFFSKQYLQWDFSQDFWNASPYLSQCAQSMQPHSPFNETHTDSPTLNSLYKQANNTAGPDQRKKYIQEMMDYDYEKGGYIIPAFIDALDAYSTKLAGYTPARVGQPLDDFNFEDFYFA